MPFVFEYPGYLCRFLRRFLVHKLLDSCYRLLNRVSRRKSAVATSKQAPQSSRIDCFDPPCRVCSLISVLELEKWGGAECRAEGAWRQALGRFRSGENRAAAVGDTRPEVSFLDENGQSTTMLGSPVDESWAGVCIGQSTLSAGGSFPSSRASHLIFFPSPPAPHVYLS